MSTQYAFRAQKTSGLADAPSWAFSSQVAETTESKCFAYSPDGEFFAQALNGSVQLVPTSASSSTSTKSIPVTSAIALNFSPLSKTLFTYERPIKSDGTDVHKNVRAWDAQSGEEVASWHHKNQDDWIPSIDLTETYRLLPTSSDLLVYSPPLAPRPSLRLKADGPIKGIFLSKPAALPEGTTSAKPASAHPEAAVAVWLGEKKGAPASVRLYPISQLVGKLADNAGEDGKTENRDLPVSAARKAFYKADKLTVKWNNAGTMALFLAQTDSDTTGKSYYGETNLYSLSLDGSFDGMVDLDKEGPIYDFVWSPTSREFSVCYGYMPARTQLYDTKNKPLHSFGSEPRNFLLYQPQGKLLLSAGFGNLAGGVDVWDISTRNKVAEFKAANSSYCEWSPCGRYIMTATLSPRLRVDNGVKIWWCGGQLLHIHPQDNLYQAAFRPSPISSTPKFPAVVPSAPEANASVARYRPKNEESNGAAAKPAGAYRPPGARGTLASDAYKRDENDGTPLASGAATPVGTYKPGQARGGAGRGVPGAPPGALAPKAEGGDKKKRVRSKRPLKEEDPSAAVAASGNATPAAEVENGVSQLSVEDKGAVDEVVAKKVRALNKKLKAIDDLKDRLAKGEVLEKTQLQKIENADAIKAEIAALGGEA